MSFCETLSDRQRFLLAAYHGRLEEVIELSSKFRYDVKVLSLAFRDSCMGGRLDVVKWLWVHTAADVNYNEWWDTPLTAACLNDHLDVVKYLMKTCHADVNLSDRGCNTSLMGTCLNNKMSISTFLLCEVDDLDVNIAGKYGNTALHFAVWCSKEHITKLHEACYNGNVTEVLRLVYVKGHNINVQDNNGFTPLHKACYGDHNDIVETLMLTGADEKITSDRGETPAQWAERRRHSELLKLLDRDSLWQEKIRLHKKRLKLSLVVLILLIVRLMGRKQKLDGESN